MKCVQNHRCWWCIPTYQLFGYHFCSVGPFSAWCIPTGMPFPIAGMPINFERSCFLRSPNNPPQKLQISWIFLIPECITMNTAGNVEIFGSWMYIISGLVCLKIWSPGSIGESTFPDSCSKLVVNPFGESTCLPLTLQKHWGYPLVKIQKNYGKIHHFSWVNPLFLGVFSIANC